MGVDDTPFWVGGDLGSLVDVECGGDVGDKSLDLSVGVSGALRHQRKVGPGWESRPRCVGGKWLPLPRGAAETGVTDRSPRSRPWGGERKG